MSDNFTANKFTPWLIPMHVVILYPDYPFQSKSSEVWMYYYHLYSNIERGAWPALAVAVVLWLAFMM